MVEAAVEVQGVAGGVDDVLDGFAVAGLVAVGVVGFEAEGFGPRGSGPLTCQRSR